MPRYQFTPDDRRKGGQTTASRYDMQERGMNGLKALAARYFDGNIKKAGKALSTMGNAVIDPFPLNGAWQDGLYRLPPSLLAQFWGHCETSDSDTPF